MQSLTRTKQFYFSDESSCDLSDSVQEVFTEVESTSSKIKSTPEVKMTGVKRIEMGGRNHVYMEIYSDNIPRYFKHFQMIDDGHSCDCKYLFETLFCFKLMQHLGIEIPNLSVEFQGKTGFLLISDRVGEGEHVDELSRTTRPEFKSEIAKIIYAGSAISLSDLANDNLIINPETGSLSLIDFETMNSTNFGSVMEPCSTFSEDEFSVARAFYLHNVKGQLNSKLQLSSLAKGTLSLEELLETETLSPEEMAIVEEFRENIETDLLLNPDDKKAIDEKLLTMTPEFLEEVRQGVMAQYFPNLQEIEDVYSRKAPKKRTSLGGFYKSKIPDTFEGHSFEFTRNIGKEIQNNQEAVLRRREAEAAIGDAVQEHATMPVKRKSFGASI